MSLLTAHQSCCKWELSAMESRNSFYLLPKRANRAKGKGKGKDKGKGRAVAQG
jgi:hypothetical protein